MSQQIGEYEAWLIGFFLCWLILRLLADCVCWLNLVSVGSFFGGHSWPNGGYVGAVWGPGMESL